MATQAAPNVPPATEQEAQYTNLQYAVSRPGFMSDIRRLLGTSEAAIAFRVEVLNQARVTPRLHQCTVESTQEQLVRVARLGLSIALDEVSLIPRSKKSVVEMHADPTHAGLRKLIMRSPEVLDCFAREVRDNDAWDTPNDPVSLPYHKIPPKFQPRGPVIGYYALIQMRSGNWRFWPMSLKEVEKHAYEYARDKEHNTYSPAWQKGKRPDTDDEGLCPFDKMALKTVLVMACNSRDVPKCADYDEGVAMSHEAHPPALTSAEYQGYRRDGTRPALMTGSGVTMASLRQDLGGAEDHHDTNAAYVRATRMQPQEPRVVTPESVEESPEDGSSPMQKPPEKVVSPAKAETSPPDKGVDTTNATTARETRKNAKSAPRRDGPEWETIVAHQHNPLLPEEMRAHCAMMLASETIVPGSAFDLASAILDIVNAQSGERVRREVVYEGPPVEPKPRPSGS
jgi:recombinational DNA repair protein RecT